MTKPLKLNGLLPLYLRREPTTDPLLIQHGHADKLDVVAYSDPECTQRKARWNWFTTPPTRANKRVMFNCWYWRVVWLDDKK